MPHGQPEYAWDWNCAVYVVNETGDIFETLALADNFDIADAAFKAAATCRSWSYIELRERGRVVKRMKTGAWNKETQTCEVLS